MGGWGFQLIRRCVRVAVLQVAGRDGEADALAGRPTVMQRVVLSGGHAATLSPLAVLVNHQSASASEILAGGAPTPLYFMLLIIICTHVSNDSPLLRFNEGLLPLPHFHHIMS